MSDMGINIPIECLTSPEFLTFGQNIKNLTEQKNQKKEELSDFVKKAKAEIKAMDDDAAKMQVEFSTWVASWVESHTKKASV